MGRRGGAAEAGAGGANRYYVTATTGPCLIRTVDSLIRYSRFIRDGHWLCPSRELDYPARRAIKRTDGGWLERKLGDKSASFGVPASSSSLRTRSSGRPEAGPPRLNAFTLWPATRRPEDTGRQVTPASAFSPHRANGGREEEFGRERYPPGVGVSENAQQKVRGGTWLPTPLFLHAKTRILPPLLERGLLGWTHQLSLGQACCQHPKLFQGRLVHSLLSPNCPAERQRSRDSWSVTPVQLDDPGARQTCRGFLKISDTRSIWAPRVCVWGGAYQLLGTGLMSPHFGPLYWSVAARGPTVLPRHPFTRSSVTSSSH